jgi:hypothetical protein
MRLDDVAFVVDRVLTHLLEVPVDCFKEHLVGFHVVAGADGADRHRALILPLRHRLPNELDLEILHGRRIPMTANRLDRRTAARLQTCRKCFLGCVVRRVALFRGGVVKLLEIRLVLQVLLEKVVRSSVIKDLP